MYCTVKLFRSAHTFSCVLQNGVLPLFKQLLQSRLTFSGTVSGICYLDLFDCFLCVFFSPNTTSFYCSSVISELFLHHLQVLGKERTVTYGVKISVIHDFRVYIQYY